MKKGILIIVFPLMLLVFGGCAIGNQYQYKAEDVGLPISNRGEPILLGVGAEDKRPYVVSGDKPDTFVGLQRGGFGNPFNVTNASGQPFAVDAAKVLSGLLQRSGYVAEVSGAYASLESFTAAMRAQGLDRGVYLDIREWKTDVMMKVTLHYDLLLKVVDSDGQVIAESNQSGTEVSSGAGFEKANSESASLSLSTKLSYLFLEPAVQEALK